MTNNKKNYLVELSYTRRVIIKSSEKELSKIKNSVEKKGLDLNFYQVKEDKE